MRSRLYVKQDYRPTACLVSDVAIICFRFSTYLSLNKSLQCVGITVGGLLEAAKKTD